MPTVEGKIPGGEDGVLVLSCAVLYCLVLYMCGMEYDIILIQLHAYSTTRSRRKKFKSKRKREVDFFGIKSNQSIEIGRDRPNK